MQPALKTFTVNPGVTFDYSFIFYQGGPGSQLPVDLTNATAQLNIQDGFGIELLQLNNQTGAINTAFSGIYFGGQEGNPTNGTIDIVISAEDSTAITWRYARYVMTLTTTSLGQQEPLYGSFVVAGFAP